jgi:hypothetical protein
MDRQRESSRCVQGVLRRDLLKASVAAGVTLSRTQDLGARRKIIHDIQRYAAEQQYIVYTTANIVTASWAPYVKNYSPNITFDYGGRAATLWLEK